mmetsp:Transcript_4581/g.11795  ORF Transcript_4581/g.11795 Transcript_4581/m.11795 type:complete len:86 (-) Transcript_4581:15-272(-)
MSKEALARGRGHRGERPSFIYDLSTSPSWNHCLTTIDLLMRILLVSCAGCEFNMKHIRMATSKYCNHVGERKWNKLETVVVFIMG